MYFNIKSNEKFVPFSDDRDECEQFNMTTTAETSSDEEGEFTCRKRKKKKKTFDGFIGNVLAITAKNLIHDIIYPQVTKIRCIWGFQKVTVQKVFF